MDKRHVYEWDTKIHLLARGPGIKAGSTWSQPATQVDLAPTFLGLAGIAKPPHFDGKSLAPLLLAESSGAVAAAPALPSTQRHLAAMGDAAAYKAAWRDAAFIEYYFVAVNDKCVGECLDVPRTLKDGYPAMDSWCGDLTSNANIECWAIKCSTDCYRTETNANNFIALRSMPGSEFGDTLYAEFQTAPKAQTVFDKPDFYEYYDNAKDKWQMDNLYNSTDGATLKALAAKLHAFYDCSGDNCP